MKDKRETITISFVGNKKFRQFVIDQIVELLQGEDFASEVVKPGCGFTIESTIQPSDD